MMMKNLTNQIFFSLLWKLKSKKMKMNMLKKDFLRCKSVKIEMKKIIWKENQQLIFRYKRIIIKNYRIQWHKNKFFNKAKMELIYVKMIFILLRIQAMKLPLWKIEWTSYQILTSLKIWMIKIHSLNFQKRLMKIFSNKA